MIIKLELLTVFDTLRENLGRFEELGPDRFWEEYAVKPVWNRLCRYAPMDLSSRKPAPVRSVNVLREQLSLFEPVDRENVLAAFRRIADALPGAEDDILTVAVCPMDDENAARRQNGVTGVSLFGGILLRVDPRVSGWEKWLPYVFAHEYHHTRWGDYWYGSHACEVKNDLCTALVIDGEADTFADSFFPALRPSWLYPASESRLARLWGTEYAPLLAREKFDYERLMFGGGETGLPWCAGYAVGYRMVQRYLSAHPVTNEELLRVSPHAIAEEAGPEEPEKTGEVVLKPIDEANFIEAFHLQLAPGQEEFVSNPVRSLAQAYVYRNQCTPFGIFVRDTMVGYVLVLYDFDVPEYDIWHLMIDRSSQGFGYGRQAMEQVLRYIRTSPFGRPDRIALTCHRDNVAAADLYQSLGFRKTGNTDGAELEWALSGQNMCKAGEENVT